MAGRDKITLRVPGTEAAMPDGSSLAGKRSWGMNVTEKKGYRIDRARAAEKPSEAEDVKNDDVIEVELEGGIKLWTTAEQFAKDFGQKVRGEREDIVTVPFELPLGGPSRGWGSWVVKGLRILGVDLPKITSVKIAEKIEDRLSPSPGLYRCVPGEKLIFDPVKKIHLRTDKPILLFIHGTASSTFGSFGGLWADVNGTLRRDLFTHYEDHVYAFQHRTISRSPLENVVELLGLLPSGARLNLVTHSRGGMIGEFLCRAGVPIDATDRKIFEEKEQVENKQALEALDKLFKEQKPRVERFVRVACPAKGTTLASQRLDRWLSIIVNVVGQVPGFKENPVYELLTDFLLAVVKQRTEPKDLRGLEAMMPTSSHVRFLNREGITVDADLSVIAGDAEASSLFGKLKLLIPDLYYQGDHDLVVDTRNMYGGVKRKTGSRSFFDQGPGVNHFSYFHNERTARLVLMGLTRSEGSDAGFTPSAALREAPAISVRRSAAPMPVVFVVPGIMGSHLAVRGNRIWIDPIDIALGNLKKLKIDNPDVIPQAPVGSAYADLIDYLGDTHEVVPFPYDWRRPIKDEALRMGDAVASKLDAAERADQPVRILAHSMGGLVTRAMIRLRHEVWDRIIRHPGGRLVMLGTPNGGSHVITRLLVGHEKILRQLATIDASHNIKELLEIIARFPGVLNMLPATDGTDFFSYDTWREFAARDTEGWVLPERRDLEEAKKFRAIIDESPIDPARMFYVAGRAPATPVGMEIDMSAPEGKRFRFLATGRGDGRVPWDTGIPKGVRTWYMDVEHGDLADYEPSFSAILDLLVSGNTERLSTSPPVVERGAEGVFPIERDVIDSYPDSEELMASALGSRRQVRPKARRMPISVSISHGNLRFTKLPVAVGHYEGDTIVSAEAYLDSRLGGMLRRNEGLGLYPGPLLTTGIFFNPDPDRTPSGAIVVGIGPVGRLTVSGLRRTMTRALLKYAMEKVEREREKTKGEVTGAISASFTSLLIGTSAGGLSVEDSVNAILHGAYRANLALQQAKLDRVVSIDRVEFVELWQDRAILAARALKQMMSDPELRGYVDCNTVVRRLEGGKHRVLYEEAPGWWDRLQILGMGDGSLRFSAVTHRARAEVSLVPTQRQLADQYISDAITASQTSREVARTLFEMLVPNDMKEQSPDRRDMVLIVNREAARYPWELMEDRWSDTKQPMAVEAGLLRQLETDEYRRKPIMASLRTALVVGDPESSFVPLPGAAAEALHVSEVLEQKNFKVTKRIRDKAVSIMTALYTDEFRILHLAGHGVYEYPVDPEDKTCHYCHQAVEKKMVTGMVIGDGAFLTPAEVNQMRRVPEVVFLNCCHLGRIEERKDTDRSRHNMLAANLAAEFIEMGVRAVVAAGWPIDDEAAKTFARTFYEQFLDGASFGYAVHTARKETYERHGAVNTWGAYQCYGDPDYRIDPSSSVRGKGEKEVQFAMAEELISELENIAGEAGTASSVRIPGLVVMLEELLQRTQQDRQDWLKRADVQAAFGKAFGELDCFAEAIGHYEKAVRSEKSGYPVKAIEQWANLTCRWAVQRARSVLSKKGTGKAPNMTQFVKEIEHAVDLISNLVSISPTSERLSLLGSASKRIALITHGERRKKAIVDMVAWYEKAAKHSSLKEYYPILNQVTGRLVLDWMKVGKRRLDKEEEQRMIATAESLACDEENNDPSFWSLVTLADCMLIHHLAGQELTQSVREVTRKYLMAADRAVSPKQLRSVLEQFDFLIEMIGSKGVSAGVRRQRDALIEIRDELAKLTG